MRKKEDTDWETTWVEAGAWEENQTQLGSAVVTGEFVEFLGR